MGLWRLKRIFEGGLEIQIILKFNHSIVFPQDQNCGLLCGLGVNKSIPVLKMMIQSVLSQEIGALVSSSSFSAPPSLSPKSIPD